MALKEDKVQVTVLVDGKQAINELGKQEMKASELRQEMKQLEAANKEYVQKSRELERAGKNFENLQKKIEATTKAQENNLKAQEKTNAQIEKAQARYNSLAEEIAKMSSTDPKFAERDQELERAGQSVENLKNKLLKLTQTQDANADKLDRTSVELKEAEKGYQELTAEVKQLSTANADYIQKQDELKKVTDNMKAQRTEMGLTGMTMRQLRQYQKELNQEWENATKGTERFKEIEARLQDVNKAIDKQKAQLRGLDSVWASIRTEVKQFGILAASYLGFEFITGQIGNIIRGNAKMSDSLADIRKTTGMTTEEVKGLVSELGKIDTRTGNAALRDIAIVGGQIGVAREEMLGFVESVDMAVVALGDEFTGGAEQVAREIGSLQRLFKETKDMDAGEAISKIGSALNELGAAGSATSPEVAEFAKRLGPLGNLAPQISQTLGLGAAFQELGLTAEISSGGLSNILLTAAKSADGFAALIGKSREEVAKWINQDPNKFILEFAESLQGLSNEQVAQVLKELGINSQEATKVMSLLAEKTDFVREKQELAAQSMAENTSLQAENNIKQATFGALIDRISKKINSLVNNQGFVKFLTSAAENTYKLLLVLQELPSFLDKSKYAILGLIVASVAFNKQLVLKKYNLIAAEVAAKRKIISDRLQTISTYNLTTATTALNVAFKANPIGFVIGLVMLLVGAFATLYTNSQKVRGFVWGIWEALKTLVVNIKDNVIGVFTGLGDIIMGVFELDGEKIKKGIEKALKSALKLHPVGLAMDSGQKMADAFNKGYNDRINLENGKPKAADYSNSPFMQQDMLQGNKPVDKLEEHRARLQQEDKLRKDAANKQKADDFLKAAEAKKTNEKLKNQRIKDAEDLRKLEEEEAKRQLGMRRSLQDLEMDLLQDGFEKKRKQAKLSYTRELEDRIINNTLSIEMEKALRAKYNAELAKLDKEEEEKKKADALTKIGNDETGAKEDVETEFLQKEYEAKLANDALAELNLAEWKQQRLWEIEKLGLEERLALLKGNDDLTVFQREQLQAKLDQLNIKSKAAGLAHERAIAAAELELQKKKYEAAGQVVSEYGNVMLDIMSVVGASSAHMAQFQKGITLAQIMIDTASAFSSLMAMSEANPANSVTGGLAGVGQYLAGIARITANVAKAKQTLTGAKAPESPSFFFGGDTGNKSLGSGDKYGNFAGYVHQNEYVIPSIVRADPQVANYEAMIESKRTGLRTSRIREESAGRSSGGDNAKMEALMLAMVEEQRANREELRNFRGRIKADISLVELKEKEDLNNQLINETVW